MTNFETITWKIKNFSTRTDFDNHNDCPTSNPKGNFYLWIDLHKPGIFGENCVTVCLSRIYELKEKLDVEWKCSMIDRDGQKRYTTVSEIVFAKEQISHSSCSGMYFIGYDFLLYPSNGLVVNDTLTLYCEIRTLRQTESLKTSTLENKKLAQNLESLLHNHKHSDVVCVVGKKEFKLHKAILSARSLVFCAMFDSELEENKQNRVEIPDVEVEVFEELLRFIYTGKLPAMDQYAWELFVISDKYQLDSLKELCEKSLTASLTVESVSKVLTLADMHNAAQLKANCVDYVTEHSTEVMQSEGWKQMVKQRLELVLELYQRISVKYEKKRTLEQSNLE